jgi:hypothetical protein
MKVRREYLILIVIISALSLYLVLHKRDAFHYRLPELPRVTDKEITKIQISKRDTAIVLTKKDNAWQIAPQGYPADANQVNHMLDVIEKIVLTAMVSESKHYDRYQLDNDNKIKIQAWAGDTLRREFEMGRAATTFRHTFVKLSDDHRVYHARGDFRNRFDLTVEKLRDKTVLSFEQGEIQEIHLSKGEQSVVFARKQVPVELNGSQEEQAENSQIPLEETIWQTADGKRGDESQLDRMLSALSKLRCEKYLDDRQKGDLADPIYTIQLTGMGKHTLAVFEKINEDSENYPATSSETDYPFLLPKWQVDNFMKNPEDFLDHTKEPPAE